jgi:hypothetical protein
MQAANDAKAEKNDAMSAQDDRPMAPNAAPHELIIFTIGEAIFS